MTIIRRQSEPDGSVFDIEVLNIMRKAYGLPDYVNNGITHVEDFVDGDTGTTAIDVRKNIAGGIHSGIQLQRNGETLTAGTYIRLFDMNGNLVRSAGKNMNLQGLNRGLYVAKSGREILKVDIR